jgi:phosphohistidine phosphatase
MTDPTTAAAEPGRRTLILLRHGKSDYPGGTRDFDRPLAHRGEVEAAAAGKWLAETQPPIDLVLCSAAVRTRQTLAATGVDAEVQYEQDIYDAGPGDVLALLRAVPEKVRTVLVVGHAPGIPSLASGLAGPGSDEKAMDEMYSKFPTSAMAVLTFTGPWSELDADGADLVAFEVARPGDDTDR